MAKSGFKTIHSDFAVNKRFELHGQQKKSWVRVKSRQKGK